MSVSVDKFLGYTIDITDMWRKLQKESGDDALDKWEGFFKKTEETDRLFNTFGFVGYYSQRDYGGIEGKVTVINDGMNGDYTKLMYVGTHIPDDTDENEKLVDGINELLGASNKIPHAFHRKLVAVYNEIFNTDYCTDDAQVAAKTEFLVHYH